MSTPIFRDDVNAVGIATLPPGEVLPIGRFRLDYLKRAIAIAEALFEYPDDQEIQIARTAKTGDDGTSALLVRPITPWNGEDAWVIVAPFEHFIPEVE
jgi:hypothetical protein